MFRLKGTIFIILLFGLVLISPLVWTQDTELLEREAMYYSSMEFPSLVKGGSIHPHWMSDGNRFWYAEGFPENTVIYIVDPRANTKTPLFDTVRLRNSLTSLLAHELPYKGLPFKEFRGHRRKRAYRKLYRAVLFKGDTASPKDNHPC